MSHPKNTISSPYFTVQPLGCFYCKHITSLSWPGLLPSKYGQDGSLRNVDIAVPGYHNFKHLSGKFIGLISRSFPWADITLQVPLFTNYILISFATLLSVQLVGHLLSSQYNLYVSHAAHCDCINSVLLRSALAACFWTQFKILPIRP